MKLDNPYTLTGIPVYIRLLKDVTNCPIRPNSSIAAYDLYERTVRCTIIGQVDFLSWLEMTCNETDGARKFRRWRYYRPTWPHLEGPSRLKSTYSTWLAGLDATAVLLSFKFVYVIHYKFNISQASVGLQSSKHTRAKQNGPMGSLYSLVNGHELIHYGFSHGTTATGVWLLLAFPISQERAQGSVCIIFKVFNMLRWVLLCSSWVQKYSSWVIWIPTYLWLKTWQFLQKKIAKLYLQCLVKVIFMKNIEIIWFNFWIPLYKSQTPYLNERQWHIRYTADGPM